MASVEIKLSGFKELEDKLKAFGPKLELSGLRSANYSGAKVVLNAAKSTSAWQDRTGTLRSSIRIFRRTSKQYTVTHAIGVTGLYMKYANTSANRRLRRVGKRYKVDGPGFYGKFLELGTSRMRAHPWLRPAFLATYGEAIDQIGISIAFAVAKLSAQS
jgi:HK97 gp10 family phage protein